MKRVLFGLLLLISLMTFAQSPHREIYCKVCQTENGVVINFPEDVKFLGGDNYVALVSADVKDKSFLDVINCLSSRWGWVAQGNPYTDKNIILKHDISYITTFERDFNILKQEYERRQQND